MEGCEALSWEAAAARALTSGLHDEGPAGPLSLRGFSIVGERQGAECAWGLWDGEEDMGGREEAKGWAGVKPYSIQRRESGKERLCLARCQPCGRARGWVPLKSCQRGAWGGRRLQQRQTMGTD